MNCAGGKAMKSSFAKVFTLILSILMVSMTIPGAKADAAGDPNDLPALSPNAHQSESFQRQISEMDKADQALTPAERKIGSDLLQLIKPEMLPDGISRDEQLNQMRSMKKVLRAPFRSGTNDSEAYVYIKVKPGIDPDVLSQYVDEITDRSDELNLIVAKVSVNRLEELAARDEVLQIRTVTPPVCNTGSVTSEGDALLDADLARSWGNIDGAGVKIGIISDGVDHMNSSVASGDLPGDVTVISNTIGGDEGTAMLEIVHDLAPGAKLYFHDYGDNILQFDQAIDELVSAGCNIICDDVSWLSEPFFEDGTIATHVKNVLASSGILYITAAGNSAEDHYQGYFVNDGYGYNDFSNGKSALTDLYVDVPPNSATSVVLQWDEPFEGSECDYDLYIYDRADFTLVASSVHRQILWDDPIEETGYYNTSNKTIHLGICVRSFTTESRDLELYINNYGTAKTQKTNISAKDSIFGQAAVPGVITVGAIGSATPGKIEGFSSQGPVTMLNESRKKPDICGVDGVRVTGAGGFDKRFYGTSAAAPHVAAIAALIWQNHPDYIAAQVKSRIINYSNDLGAAGFDYLYGYGRINAYFSALDLYDVTFDPNDGSMPDTYAYPVNGMILSPSSDPIRTGYTFNGWYKDQACSIPWNFDTDILTSDLTLYAKWTINIYTVTIQSFGDNTYGPISAPYNSTILNPGIPVREGYVFGGWCSDDYCANLWDFETNPVLGDMTLYARWIPIVLPSPAAVTPASKDYTSITVNWTPVRWADGYEVWYCATATGTFTLSATTTSPVAIIGGLTMNKAYYFQVRAFRNDTPIAYGEYSSVASAKPLPAAPPSFKATPVSHNAIRITWSKVPEAAMVELYRSASSTGTYQLLTTTNALLYTNTGVVTGVTYYYKARSYKLAGGAKIYGDYTAVISAAAVPAVPSTVKASANAAKCIRINWGKAAGATKYEVWRCTTSASGTYALLTTTTALSYSNTGLTAGKQYWYKVRAFVVLDIAPSRRSFARERLIARHLPS